MLVTLKTQFKVKEEETDSRNLCNNNVSICWARFVVLHKFNIIIIYEIQRPTHTSLTY